MEEQMKNQNGNKIVFALTGLLLVALFAVSVIAQSAPQGGHPTWTNSGYGIAVTEVPSPTRDKVTYEFKGSGKNGGPSGTGTSGPMSVPVECPRNANGGYYSEDVSISMDDGTTATLKITRKPDCSKYSMKVTVGNKTFELFKKK